MDSPATVLLIVRDGPAIGGMLTLVLFRIPTGVRADARFKFPAQRAFQFELPEAVREIPAFGSRVVMRYIYVYVALN